MRPFTVLLIVAASLFCCYASEVGEPPYPPVYDRVVECITRFLYANPPGTKKRVPRLMCDAFRGMYPCLTKPFSSNSSIEVLELYRAYQLQRIFLAHKSKLCKKRLPYQELKELVDKSDIIRKQNLTSIEDDTYVKCAGKLNIKCFRVSVKAMKSGFSNLLVMTKHIECEEKESKKCSFPITQHMNAFVHAMGKQMMAHGGLLAKMIAAIKPEITKKV